MPEWLIAFATNVTLSPLTWFGIAVANWLGALFLGEVVARRWREVAIWVPVALVAVVAMRPWPTGPIQDSAPSVAHYEMAFKVQGGLFHSDTCERLHEGTSSTMTTAQIATAHVSPCPDCMLKGAE